MKKIDKQLRNSEIIKILTNSLEVILEDNKNLYKIIRLLQKQIDEMRTQPYKQNMIQITIGDGVGILTNLSIDLTMEEIETYIAKLAEVTELLLTKRAALINGIDELHSIEKRRKSKSDISVT